MTETSPEPWRYTRLSFLYPLSYLVPCSLVLVFAPGFLLEHFSNGHYSPYITRLVGAAMTGFTIMVLNVFVHRAVALYPAVIYVRLPVLAIVAWLYAESHDPLFLLLLVTVAPGVVLSTVAHRIDARRLKASAPGALAAA